MPYVCTGCQALARSSDDCYLCGSTVVPAGAAPSPRSEPVAAVEIGPQAHHGMLLGGLAALNASIIVGIVATVVSDAVAALFGALLCALAAFAMLLPWRERHGMDDPARKGQAAPLGTSSTPYLVLLVAGIGPLLIILFPGPGQLERIVAVVFGWLGFGLLYLRHTRRELEADGYESRNVPT